MMSTSVDEAHFMNMLMKVMNAKNTMEIGVYTCYSLLTTALALPNDGKILAIDVNREYYELGLPVIKKAGVAHKIEIKEGLALNILHQMNQDGKHEGAFDFVVVDADKNNYLNYRERLIKLIKVGGVIGYDNTLWNGSVVAPPSARLPDYIVHSRGYIVEFNKALAADPRVEISQLSLGDDITLCRRII